MSPLPTVRCPDFLHNSVRSIHLGQYLQDAHAINSHRSVFNSGYRVRRSRAQDRLLSKTTPINSAFLLSNGEPEFPPTTSLVVRNVQRQIQIELVLCLRPTIPEAQTGLVLCFGQMRRRLCCRSHRISLSFTGPLAWPNDRRSVPVASGYIAKPRNAKSALAIFSPPLAKGASTCVS